MSRIVDGTRVGHASWSQDYAIGVKSCAGCGVETPGPPQDVLDDLASRHSTISTVWPFEHWQPPGWSNLTTLGYICAACSRAVMALLAARRGGESQLANGDLAILEENFARALVLVDGGLANGFPPAPLWRSGAERYHFQDPNGDTVYQTQEHYREGMLRKRIRAIGNVLRGKPERAP